MNIQKYKALEENENYIVLKTGNHKYCVYKKDEERIVFESTCPNGCYKFLHNKNSRYPKKMMELYEGK